MKKLLSIIIIILTLVSCSQDVKFNNEAVFQGVKDNSSWQGGNAKAVLDNNNNLTISAATINETITLKIPMPITAINPKNRNTFVTYTLGTSSSRKASYSILTNGILYEYETGAAVGDGEIVISEYDGVILSGTFRFNAENTDAGSEAAPLVNFQRGTLYKIPIVPSPI
ncbi:MAG: hypothetical protein H7199_12915 [Burkholderiales bacterium]|nr:hypothetical protein [Flavobacterium sp.]